MRFGLSRKLDEALAWSRGDVSRERGRGEKVASVAAAPAHLACRMPAILTARRPANDRCRCDRAFATVRCDRSRSQGSEDSRSTASRVIV